VDAVMCSLQGDLAKVTVVRHRALSVRVGVARLVRPKRNQLREIAMAKTIEFYVPSSFRKSIKWTPVQERGKLIEFSLIAKRSA
jgi:hypothetical protein